MERFANAQFAAGYLFGLAPPLLLVIGLAAGVPWLAFAVLIGAFPFLRIVFGDAASAERLLDERTATCLHYLPYFIALSYIASFVVAIYLLRSQNLNAVALVGYGLSQWVVAMFCSCVAHELLHRRDPGARVLARILNGLILYPLLEHEHRMHHAREGGVLEAEWAAPEESVWTFSARRLRCVLRSAWCFYRAVPGRCWSSGLTLSIASAAAHVGLLVTATGSTAVVLAYALASLAVMWALQNLTYIQHWGLGNSVIEGRVASWEDLCRVQAWLTLNISLHHSHHVRPSVPYYRLSPTRAAPRPPAGYVVLFFCAMFPRAWFRLMTPVLDAWLDDPRNRVSVGRRLVCFRRAESTKLR